MRSDRQVKVRYVRETGAYGRSSFRRVEEPLDNEPEEKKYVACDFGVRMALNEAEFFERLSPLSPEDRTYITDIPWPRAIVWHILDEKMQRIFDKLGMEIKRYPLEG